VDRCAWSTRTVSKGFCKEHGGDRENHVFYSHQCSTRGIMVCTNLQRTLYQHIHHQDMVYFLANHLSIDEQRVHTDLAWHSFDKARKECSFPMQKFISKWPSRDTATGLVIKGRKQRLHAHCPRCGEDDEHLLHVLICSVNFRQPLLSDLEAWLIDENTHPDIVDYLLTGLTS
jgi:hypothetical protein